jgi:predicted secreted protein
MNYVNGEDRILFIKINGVYMPIACLTSNGIEESSETIETTTRDNNGWKTDKVVVQSYSVPFAGLQINSTVAGGVFNVASYDRIKMMKRAKTLLDWKIQGTIYPIVDYGQGTITQLSSTESAGEFLSFSGLLLGFGKPLVQDLGGVVLNNGDPNILLNTGDVNEIIKVQ